MSIQSNKQYRPYFTPGELLTIHDALRTISSNESLAVAKKLDLIIYKIRADMIASRVITPRESIDSKLGFSKEDSDNNIHASSDYVPRSPEECYNLAITGNQSSLTSNELVRVQQYRYENDLMTPQEEKDFESSIGLGG